MVWYLVLGFCASVSGFNGECLSISFTTLPYAYHEKKNCEDDGHAQMKLNKVQQIRCIGIDPYMPANTGIEQ